MQFKYYDTLSNLISGMALLFALSLATKWDINQVNAVVLTAIAYILGYVLNALSAIIEPAYCWMMGGMPSDVLLTPPKPSCRGKIRDYTGYGRVRFYEYDKAILLLRDELNDPIASTKRMFGKAMSYSNSDGRTRVPDFNAQYGFARVMLTLGFVVAAIVIPLYYTLWWVWGVAALSLLLLGHRCKERGYYFAREVLVEYIKCK